MASRFGTTRTHTHKTPIVTTEETENVAIVATEEKAEQYRHENDDIHNAATNIIVVDAMGEASIAMAISEATTKHMEAVDKLAAIYMGLSAMDANDETKIRTLSPILAKYGITTMSNNVSTISRKRTTNTNRERTTKRNSVIANSVSDIENDARGIVAVCRPIGETMPSGNVWDFYRFASIAGETHVEGFGQKPDGSPVSQCGCRELYNNNPRFYGARFRLGAWEWWHDTHDKIVYDTTILPELPALPTTEAPITVIGK